MNMFSSSNNERDKNNIPFDGIFRRTVIPKRLREDDMAPSAQDIEVVLRAWRSQKDDTFAVENADFGIMPHQISGQQIHFPFFVKRKFALRAFFAFGAFLFVAMAAIPSFILVRNGITLKDDVTERGIVAASIMEGAVDALEERNFAEAENKFYLAERELVSVRAEYRSFGAGILPLIAAVPFPNPLRSGDRILDAALSLSRAGRHMVRISQSVGGANVENLFNGAEDADMLFDLSSAADEFVAASEEMNRAHDALEDVDIWTLPTSIRERAAFLKNIVATTSSQLSFFAENNDTVFSMMGEKAPRRYLFVLQNTSELRATGGFAGNVALLKLYKGRVEKLEFYDVYDLDGQLIESIIPPKPLQEIAGAWSLHDANWFFDFPESARKMSLYYEKDGGPTPDGVIAITSSVAEDLLRIVGPIRISDGTELSAENFVDYVNNAGEKAKNVQRSPQNDVLQEMFNTIVSRMESLDSSDAKEIVRMFARRTASKDIQIYMREEKEQKFAESLGVAGAYAPRVIDDRIAAHSIGIVHSNINGYKTDKVIREHAAVESSFGQDGFVYTTVTVTRTHGGRTSPYDFYRKVNKDYMRIYTPAGSELMGASGFTELPETNTLEYDKLGFLKDRDVELIHATYSHSDAHNIDVFSEFGRTVFGGWNFVSPGETVLLSVTYRTPILSGYDGIYFVLEKQAGVEPIVSIEVFVPGRSGDWNGPAGEAVASDRYRYAGPLESNISLHAVLHK